MILIAELYYIYKKKKINNLSAISFEVFFLRIILNYIKFGRKKKYQKLFMAEIRKVRLQKGRHFFEI